MYGFDDAGQPQWSPVFWVSEFIPPTQCVVTVAFWFPFSQFQSSVFPLSLYPLFPSLAFSLSLSLSLSLSYSLSLLQGKKHEPKESMTLLNAGTFPNLRRPVEFTQSCVLIHFPPIQNPYLPIHPSLLFSLTALNAQIKRINSNKKTQFPKGLYIQYMNIFIGFL